MKILKPGKVNLACLIFGHTYEMRGIENRYIGNGEQEFTHTCCRCGKKERVILDERWLGLPPRNKE